MTDALAFLWPPFLIATVLVVIHAYFGIQVLARKVIFVDLALAQIAALGGTVAFMLGHAAQGSATYLYSLAFTLLAAILLAFTRSWATRIPQEALIGVIYVVAAATSILLIDRAPQGAEHLKQILTGNILTSGLEELRVIVPLYAAVGLLHWFFRPRLAGGASLPWEFAFYASFGVVVTSSVAIAGVLPVFTFLIVPAAIGVIYASSLGRQLAIACIAGTATNCVGLGLSFMGDLPTGAALVCTFGGSLVVAGVLYPFLRGNARRALAVTAKTIRSVVAVILIASGLQLVIAPRADQPLLDMVEYAVPTVRAAYFTETEQMVYANATRHAERYQREIDRLNEQERQSRAGEGLDDVTVRRLSSLVKSYSEMRNGELFVLGEVRARARLRGRWLLSVGLIVAAAFIAPIDWRGSCRATGKFLSRS